jgi:hypothetical protein
VSGLRGVCVVVLSVSPSKKITFHIVARAAFLLLYYCALTHASTASLPASLLDFNKYSTNALVELKAATDATAASGTEGEWHADNIRGVTFDRTGRFLATIGDDKAIRLWKSTDGAVYECVKRVIAQKKLCAVSFTDDGEHVLFANKYGDVQVLPTAPAPAVVAAGEGGIDAEGEAVTGADAPAFLLGHCCSIITVRGWGGGLHVTQLCTAGGARITAAYSCDAETQSELDDPVTVDHIPCVVSTLETCVGLQKTTKFCRRVQGVCPIP